MTLDDPPTATDESHPATPPVSRGRASWAGLLAAAAALGTAEIMSGLLTGGESSLVVAVGNAVIDFAPPIVKDVAIDLFGTTDKPALIFGIVILSGLFGVLLGRASANRFWVGAVGFGLFGVLGFLSAARDPAWTVGEALVAAIVAAGVGIGALALLLRAAQRDATAAAGPEVNDPQRRRFLWTAGVVGGVAVLGAAGGRMYRGRAAQAVSASRDEVQLPPAAETVPPPAAEASFDLEGLSPLVTPTEDFYRIDTALFVPRIDPAAWTLGVTGMVEQPLEISYADLIGRDLVERYVTLSCVSNEVGGDLVGNAKWLGVPLREILDEAGVMPGATQVVGRSVDDFTVGFPTEAAFDGREALIAVGMNGEPLPFDHGFPARLVVAGLYGYVSATKWLKEIELTTLEDFDAYWIPRGWSKEAPIKTQARIDVPRRGVAIPPGPQVAAGVAWAPDRGIIRVEVKIDEGPWMDAEVSQPLGKDSWVQWRLPWVAEEGRQTLRVRATDGTGEVQTSQSTSPRPDGASGYHAVGIRVG